MNSNYFILILFFLIFNGCKNEPERIHGFEMKDSFCSEAKEISFPHKIKFVDNKNEFSIDFPENWFPEEDLIDSIHGVVATDTTFELNEVFLIGISEYSTSYSELKDYFSDELQSIIIDPEFKAYEIGKSKLNGQETYWLLYEMTADSLGDHRGLIHYLKGNRENQFYLIETTVYGLDNLKDKICKSMEIIKTFEIIKNGA